MLLNERLRRMNLVAVERSWFADLMTQRQVSDHDGNRCGGLYQIASIAVGALGGRLALLGSALAAARRIALADSLAATMILGLRNRGIDGACRMGTWTSELTTDEAQRQARHQKPSKVAEIGSHDSILGYARRPCRVESLSSSIRGRNRKGSVRSSIQRIACRNKSGRTAELIAPNLLEFNNSLHSISLLQS